MLEPPPSARPSSTAAARCSCSAARARGKTTVARRALRLARGATARRRSRVLALTLADGAADALREQRRGPARRRPTRSCRSTTFQRPLRAAAARRGARGRVDPFATPVAAADRLAMLLERIDELPLRHHDLRGNPRATLGAIVRRIDRAQGRARSRAADYARVGRARCPSDARGAREREFAALYAAHDRLLREAGALDAGDLVLHAFRLLREQAARARARWPRATGTCSSTSCRTRASPRACCCGCSWPSTASITAFADDDQAIHRFRGAATKNIRDFRAEWPLATRRPPGASRCARAARLLAAARRGRGADRGPPGRRRSTAADAAPGEVAFWRCASERAQAQAVAAEVERLIARGDVAPEDVCVLVRSVRAEGQAVAVAFEERAVPYHLSRRGGVLPARRGPRPARLAAAAGRPRRRGRRRARAGAPAGRAARDRPRARDADRAPAQARHGRGAERRARVAADPARGARADRRASSSSTAPRPRALDSSRPDLYVHRLIERLGLRRQLLFAATTEVVERLRNLARFAELAAAYVRRAPQATRARVRPLDRRRRRRRAARGGGGGRRARARRARDDDARRQGPRVRARLRARA